MCSRWVTLLLLLAGAAGRAEVSPGVYLAFGDSITAGFDDDVGGLTPGYPGYLEPMLQVNDPSAAVINAGSIGEQTGSGVIRLPALVNAHHPQFALIMEGINDISHGASASSIAFNLDYMTRICEARGTIPILATILPIVYDPSVEPTIDATNALITEIAGDQSVVGLADAHTAMSGHPEYFGGEHPNQAGYQVLASIWFDAIQRRGTNPPPPIEGGDIDGSGLVDGWDLIRLARAFGSATGDERFDPAADLNFDGVIDGTDLAELASNFGRAV